MQQELRAICEDQIAAQTWAWLSKDNCIVFDSWESKNQKTDKFCEPILLAAAKQLLEKNISINAVLLGDGGKTPQMKTCPLIKENLYLPADYQGYRDSCYGQYMLCNREDLNLQNSAIHQETSRYSPGLFAVLPYHEDLLTEQQSALSCL